MIKTEEHGYKKTSVKKNRIRTKNTLSSWFLEREINFSLETSRRASLLSLFFFKFFYKSSLLLLLIPFSKSVLRKKHQNGLDLESIETKRKSLKQKHLFLV